MSDDRITETTVATPVAATPATSHTTVVERRTGGGGSGLLMGLILLIALAIGAYYLLNQGKNDAIRTDAVSQAAKDVGAAAKDVGESAKKAVE